MMAGTSGMIAASVLNWFQRGVPDVEPLINGGLAGLVAITACCNAVTNSPGGVYWGDRRSIDALGGTFIGAMAD